MPKEIVTLQIGGYSNYVGTHWWNIQEASFVYDEKNIETELDHDVLFRAGHNSRDVTFTPRLVFVDFNKSLGTLPVEGTLYNTVSNHEEGMFCTQSSLCQFFQLFGSIFQYTAICNGNPVL